MKLAASIISTLIVLSSSAFAEPKVLEFEKPVLLQARKLQPFEIRSGTFFDLVLMNTNEMFVSAHLSSNIYDFYGNVAIPKGSQLFGSVTEKRGERIAIKWTSLQIPSLGTLKLDPPIFATMRDGSAGVTELKPGGMIGAINGESFIIPH